MSSWTELWTERRRKHVPLGVGNVSPFFIARAQGAWIQDVDGKEFIDFAGGIGVNNVGHRHPAVVEAIKAQADEFLHSCFHVMMYQTYIEVAERLNEIIPCRKPAKTMLANSGAEAVENAVKIARHYTGRMGIVCFDNAFHGRTFLTMALTSKMRPYKLKLGSMMAPGIFRAHYPYCYRCPWGKSYPQCGVYCGQDYFEGDFFKRQVDPEEVAAVIIEPVQGEGGFMSPPQEYLAKLRQVCDRYGLVLIVDEIQSGFARTGRMFATEHFGIEADLVTTGKSLAGGLPLSAVTGRAEIMDSVHAGGLGGTFGGNPLACRAALAVLDAIRDEDLVSLSEELGRKVRAELERLEAAHPIIGQVRGLGPMLALELVKDRQTKEPAADEAKELVRYCQQHGLLILDCGTLGNNVRTLMPLTITPEQLARGLEILGDGLGQLSR